MWRCLVTVYLSSFLLFEVNPVDPHVVLAARTRLVVVKQEVHVQNVVS